MTAAQPLLSVVTPVYNAARFLHDAYRSLCEQEGVHWEWVVVNDGSTDESGQLLQQWAATDERIRYYEQPNSGSAKFPRDRAVYHSQGDFIVFLDADDYLSPDYLHTLLQRQQATDADIVYARMHVVDCDGADCSQVLPADDFDTSRTYVGRELVVETLPEWRIGCNGGLYRKSVWVNMSYPKKEEPVWVNSDEVDERLYLLQAKCVVFCDAVYYYRRHQDAITVKFAVKRFDMLQTCQSLLQLMKDEFGVQSPEYAHANQLFFDTWRWLLRMFVVHYREFPDSASSLYRRLAESCYMLKPQLLTRRDRWQFFHMRHFFLIFACFCLKYSPRTLPEYLHCRFFSRHYRQHVLKRRTEQRIADSIASSYADNASAASRPAVRPWVVSVFCGNVSGGGLVDRLRGVVSTYQVCRSLGEPFKLSFTHPFRLEEYLEPNTYDWRISADELSFHSAETIAIISDTLTDSPDERQRQRALIAQQIKANPTQQKHVYTNAAFCYDHGFADDFHALFRPSQRLQTHLDAIQQQIGAPYIAVSARFRKLLNDFNEENYGDILSVEARQSLLAQCMEQLDHLHERHPQHRLLVCSDSTTFLQSASERDYVYIIPGTVSHIDNDIPHDYEYYEKTFLDFFTIARASKVYLLKLPPMFNSGFPYAAALCGGVEFAVQTSETHG